MLLCEYQVAATPPPPFDLPSFGIKKYWPGQPFQATSRAAAVSFAIVGMMLTGTLHPPGAATALIAALGGSGIANTGWLVRLPENHPY